MRRHQVAVVGAAETTELGVIPNTSQIQLHADAALNAAIQAVMTAREIDEDFARRRAELTSWCDAEKEAIFARLRAASRTE